MKAADEIVEALLDDEDDLDPKAMAMRTTPATRTEPTDIAQVYVDQILRLPCGSGLEGIQSFNAAASQLVDEMISKLEAATGRKALPGTGSLILSWMPRPWNHDPGFKVTRKYAREVAAGFRACSEPVRI